MQSGFDREDPSVAIIGEQDVGKVKVDAADTEGYLADKLVAGNNVSFVQNADTITISTSAPTVPGHQILGNGQVVALQPNLDFIGDNITVVDNHVDGSTEVTISTSIKISQPITDATLNCERGYHYICNGVTTANLPAGEHGMIIGFADYGSMFSGHPLTIVTSAGDTIVNNTNTELILDRDSSTVVLGYCLDRWILLAAETFRDLGVETSAPEGIEVLDGDRGDIIVSNSGAQWTLETTGVTPGTYALPEVTVDAKGRITSINGFSEGDRGDIIVSSGGAVWELNSTGVTPGTYNLATLTINQDGRIEFAEDGSNVTEYTGGWLNMGAWDESEVSDALTASVSVTVGTATETSTVGLVFAITLSQSSNYSTIVNYTLSGDAVGGVDYVIPPSFITIPPTVTMGVVNIVPIDDLVEEGNKTVTITLDSGTNNNNPIAIGSATVTGVITENDTPGGGVDNGLEFFEDTGTLFLKLDFENNASPLSDTSGNNRTVTPVEALTVSTVAREGTRSLVLAGAYLGVNNQVTTETEQWSVSCWFKVRGIWNYAHHLFSTPGYTNDETAIQVFVRCDPNEGDVQSKYTINVNFEQRDNLGNRYRSGTSVNFVDPVGWNQVLVAKVGSVKKAYLNGVEIILTESFGTTPANLVNLGWFVLGARGVIDFTKPANMSAASLLSIAPADVYVDSLRIFRHGHIIE